MADLELVGVPFDGYGRSGRQSRAAAALREAGLLEAFDAHRLTAVDDVRDLPPPDPSRGPHTGLINEAALLAMTEQLNGRVGEALRRNGFPVVYGGDCATLLGIVTGLRDHVGATGLMFVDGHEDTMPLDVSEDGEAANAEIGLLLGLTGRPVDGPLGDALPALSSELLAVLGPRDERWRRRFDVGSLKDVGVWFASVDEVLADPAAAGADAAAMLVDRAGTWWLHVDLDVLDPLVFGAQGLPDVADDPGGLDWPHLTALLTAALAQGGCLGLSLAIYDPDQDDTGADARRIVELVRELAAFI